MSAWWLLLIIPAAVGVGVLGGLLWFMWQFAKGMNW